MKKLNWTAIWKPAVSISVFLLPIGIIQQVLVDDHKIGKSSAAALLFFAAILFLAAVCGFGSARLVDHDLAQHGAASAGLAYVIVQGVGVIRHLIIDKPLQSPISFVYLALLTSTCGMLGAMLERRQRRLSALRDDAGSDGFESGGTGLNGAGPGGTP
jgi:hypothetical protein